MSSFPLSSEVSRYASEMRGSSVPLSEAFLDTSFCTRFNIPERYQEHFDELRNGILTFCKDFQIPNEALKDLKAFGDALTSHRPLIPLERIGQVLPLFQELEHLVTNKEPFEEEPSEPLEYAEHLYHLKEQYASQVALLERVGILKEGAITGIDGHRYPIPTLEQISARLFEQKETLRAKRDQGFTKLLLVPFGMSLGSLIDIFQQFLFDYKQTHATFILCDESPIHMWDYREADIGDHPELIYDPKSFDRGEYQGKTKIRILEEQRNNQDSFSGWKVHLFQPSDPDNSDSPGFASVPGECKGTMHGKKFPRLDLEAGQTPKEYLSILQEAQNDPTSPYYHEFGIILEDWILAFTTHLAETGEPLDNILNPTGDFCYLLGALFLPHHSVPTAVYSRQIHFVGDVPDECGDGLGTRFSVRIS